MASILPSSLINDIRGGVGSEVYSRNASGLYVRTKGTWVQPDTQRQLDVRAAITALSQAWSATLSEAQRATWRTYALAYPRKNRFGRPNCTKPFNRFVRLGTYRYRHDQSIPFTSAPPAPPLHRPTFTFTADADADTITIALPPTNYPTPFANLRLYVFIGQPTTPGVSYFSTPWRYAHQNLYNGSWATDPWTFASPWPIAIGQRVWAYMLAQHDTEGQLSTANQTNALAT